MGTTKTVWLALPASDIESVDLRPVRRADPDAQLLAFDPGDDLDSRTAALLKVADVAVSRRLPAPLLGALPSLRWVQSIHSGVDRLIDGGHGLAELSSRSIRVTNAAGVGADTIAEFVFAQLLSFWKRLPDISNHQADREWVPTYGRRVAGSTLALVGVGAVGSQIAQRAQGFGMHVLASTRSAAVKRQVAYVNRLFAPSAIAEMFALADAAVITAPATPETFHLIGERELRALPVGTFFCNVSRGTVVDSESLLAACADGHLGLAALDVFEEEPLPRDDPLWRLPNVRVSAHCSVSNEGYLQGAVDLFGDNLLRYRTGQPLHNLVDLWRGY